MKRKCIICSKEFQTKVSRKVVCSVECTKKRRSELRRSKIDSDPDYWTRLRGYDSQPSNIDKVRQWRREWRRRNPDKVRREARERMRRRAAILKAAENLGLINNGDRYDGNRVANGNLRSQAPNMEADQSARFTQKNDG